MESCQEKHSKQKYGCFTDWCLHSVLDFLSLDFYYLVYSNDLQVYISSPNLSA